MGFLWRPQPSHESASSDSTAPSAAASSAKAGAARKSVHMGGLPFAPYGHRSRARTLPRGSEVLDGAGDSVLEGDHRLPAELLLGARDVRTPSGRVVLGERLVDDAALAPRLVDDELRELLHRELVRIPEVRGLARR